MHILTVYISYSVIDKTNIAIAKKNRKSSIGFLLGYLHVTLTHSKGQSQGDANIYCEYLVNGDVYDKYFYWQYIGSRVLALD